MKIFAITNNLNESRMNSPESSTSPVHGANVVLGGAMLSGIILAIFILCYCCHKSSRKSMIWRDNQPELALQIYTVEAAQSRHYSEMEDCGSSERSATPGPPPYDSLIIDTKAIVEPPSYEVALRGNT